MRSLTALLVLAPMILAATPRSAAASPWENGRRWSIGLRSTGQLIGPEERPDDQLGLTGGGWTLRWRQSPRLSWEMTIEQVQSFEGEGGGAPFERVSTPVTFTGLWHLSQPWRRWDFYLLMGMGATESEVSYLNANRVRVSERFDEVHFHMGMGVERVWRRWGLGAEWRLIGSARDEEQVENEVYVGQDYGPVPAHSSGSQLSFTFNYYF
jgi:hypothetical protein